MREICGSKGEGDKDDLERPFNDAEPREIPSPKEGKMAGKRSGQQTGLGGRKGRAQSQTPEEGTSPGYHQGKRKN